MCDAEFTEVTLIINKFRRTGKLTGKEHTTLEKYIGYNISPGEIIGSGKGNSILIGDKNIIVERLYVTSGNYDLASKQAQVWLDRPPPGYVKERVMDIISPPMYEIKGKSRSLMRLSRFMIDEKTLTVDVVEEQTNINNNVYYYVGTNRLFKPLSPYYIDYTGRTIDTRHIFDMQLVEFQRFEKQIVGDYWARKIWYFTKYQPGGLRDAFKDIARVVLSFYLKNDSVGPVVRRLI